MDDVFATSYDIIVLGTGFVESLVAAAAARIGKKVLHLDKNGYYGGQWASFSLKHLLEWSDSNSNCDNLGATSSFEDEGNTVRLSNTSEGYVGVSHEWNVREEPLESETPADSTETKGIKIWSKSELLDLNRKFNLDLAPKVLYSRGSLVELLISSNVARYVEFKCISRILTWMNPSDGGEDGRLAVVPCSRSDVFTTDLVKLSEKRRLMKFLEFCHDYEQHKEYWEEYTDLTFREFLESQKLTKTLIHFVTSAIAMVNEDVPCLEGLQQTSLFLNSLGRYGSMPFLFSLYGSGEMPQAFCRLCAVFEGTYMLRRNVEHIILDEEGKVSGISSEGIEVNCSHLLMNASYAPSKFLCQQPEEKSLSRAILLTDRSIYPVEKEQLTLMRMPTNDSDAPITIIEVGAGSGICPSQTYCVHLTCVGKKAKEDFRITVERLFQSQESEETKPKILFSLYFNQAFRSDLNLSKECPSNALLCSGPNASLDYDDSILEAKSIFRKLYPGEDFLPRAPDPDEIVFDNDGVDVKPGDTFAEEPKKEEEEKEKEEAP